MWFIHSFLKFPFFELFKSSKAQKLMLFFELFFEFLSFELFEQSRSIVLCDDVQC